MARRAYVGLRRWVEAMKLIMSLAGVLGTAAFFEPFEFAHIPLVFIFGLPITFSIVITLIAGIVFWRALMR